MYRRPQLRRPRHTEWEGSSVTSEQRPQSPPRPPESPWTPRALNALRSLLPQPGENPHQRRLIFWRGGHKEVCNYSQTSEQKEDVRRVLSHAKHWSSGRRSNRLYQLALLESYSGIGKAISLQLQLLRQIQQEYGAGGPHRDSINNALTVAEEWEDYLHAFICTISGDDDRSIQDDVVQQRRHQETLDAAAGVLWGIQNTAVLWRQTVPAHLEPHLAPAPRGRRQKQ